MPSDSFASMRTRIEQCRRLAALTHDPRVSEALLQMADEIEADLNRFEGRRLGTGCRSRMLGRASEPTR